MACFHNIPDRINGHPGGYVRIAGKWRLEEVSKKYMYYFFKNLWICLYIEILLLISLQTFHLHVCSVTLADVSQTCLSKWRL